MKLRPEHERAAQRLADGRMTQARIAAEVGVSDVALWKWQKDADFAALVQQHRDELHDRLVKKGAADKQARINGQVERLQLYWDLLAARASDGQAALDAASADATEAMAALRSLFGKGGVVAGVETGLLTKTYKQIGKVLQEEWAVDTGLLAEMRALEKQIAQELGEWTEKREVGGLNGGPALIRVLYDDAASAPSPSGPAGGDTGEPPV